jgi:hypothetical protein
MFFVDTDFHEGDGAAATFHARIKSGGNGSLWAQVYASSGCVSRTPHFVSYGYTTSGNGWLQATAISASQVGIIGLPSGAIASGCVGWVQIRGAFDNVAGPATSFTGSIGHAVYWGGATGLGATGSAYRGLPYHVGFLLEGVSSSTTANIFLAGNLYAQSL